MDNNILGIYNRLATMDPDVRHDVIVRLLERQAQGKSIDIGITYGIYRHIVADRCRQRKRLQRALMLTQPLMRSAWSDAHVDMSIDMLPQPLREVAALVRAGYTPQECSALLGISARAVYDRLARIRDIGLIVE